MEFDSLFSNKIKMCNIHCSS